MCGIAGFVGGFVPGLGRSMNAAQAHRGPDGQGVHEDPDAGVMLAHVRLAVLDVTPAAAQPMTSADGRFTLVYNGEIYNFRELRKSLAGASFRSSGDTEVLLEGLARHGVEFLPRLNGMFAFALWDRETRRLLLARDNVGVKPLYVAEPAPGSLLFASEIKALFAHPGVTREPDFEALQEHLARGHASGAHTAFRGVRRVLPGTLVRWDAATHTPELETWWRPFTRSPLPRALAVEDLRTKLLAATRRQMVSDVPVGLFLSGGLDSSLVAACAAKDAAGPLRSYTVTYPRSENVLDQFDDDAPHARSVAGHLGLNHAEIEIRPDVAALLHRLIRHSDEPLADPAMIAAHLVSRRAREDGLVVMLTGQGADELFGGYPRYRAMAGTRWLEALPGAMRRAISAGAKALPGAKEGRAGGLLRRGRRVLSSASLSRPERFMALCSSTPDSEIAAVLSDGVRLLVGGHDSAAEDLAVMGSAVRAGDDAFLYRDLMVYLPNHNLHYTDRMSMASGLEARVPLLDLELLETATAYPASWKFSARGTKLILREAARGLVPESIIRRRKAGFGAPYRKWLRYDLDELWGDVMSEASVKRRGWFDAAGLKAARDRSQGGREDLYMLQWAALVIELWAREFIDRRP
ncbi:MAG: asparagine synthase (glutamine-hydrolyzing) [Planctomycetia bacterium]|nr:asparagine synthase (glutamine-hydrolyzing) [Planctomycetia bacterium]